VKRLLKVWIATAVVGLVALWIKRWLEEQANPVYELPGDESTELAEEFLDESELGGEVNPELLEILVDPLDKGPLELSSDGKWLINPRNGYRYPIRRGIPVMLIEEGRKYRDESLIRQGNGAG